MKAIVALGSNLGDRFEYLQKAVNEINSLKEIEVSKISSVYETLPVGGPEQGNYLNAVISLNTELEADELLLKLLLIELNLGRQREIAWGPRTIDLDLIWFEDQTINLENLVINLSKNKIEYNNKNNNQYTREIIFTNYFVNQTR